MLRRFLVELFFFFLISSNVASCIQEHVDLVFSNADDLALSTIQNNDALASSELQTEGILLFTTVDGKLHALNTQTGSVLWTFDSSADADEICHNYLPVNSSQLASTEMAKVSDSSFTGHVIDDGEYIWFIEPVHDGKLYAFNRHTGMLKAHHTIRELVDLSPIRVLGPDTVFVGSKETTLFTVDLITGNVLKRYNTEFYGDRDSHLGKKTSSTRDTMQCMPAVTNDLVPSDLDELEHLQAQVMTQNVQEENRIADIALVEYTVTIYSSSHVILSAKYIEWLPSYQDTIFLSHYDRPESDHVAIALPENFFTLFDRKLKKPLYFVNTSAPISNAFNVYTVSVNRKELAATNRRTFVLPQRHLSFSDFAFQGDNEAVYVNHTEDDVWFALSSDNYPSIMATQNATCYTQHNAVTLESLTGLHFLNKAIQGTFLLGPSHSFELLPPTTEPLSKIHGSNNSTNSFFKELLAIILFMTGLVICFLLLSRSPFIKLKGLMKTSKEATRSSEDAKYDTNVSKRRRKKANKKKKAAKVVAENQPYSLESDDQPKLSVVHDVQKALDINRLESFENDVILGPLEVSSEILGYGSHGTIVFRGQYEGRSVAVKRVLLDFYDIATREVTLLQKADFHPNVVRYYCRKDSGKFSYIALELCECSLFDFFEKDPKPTIVEAFEPYNVMRQIVLGVYHLHRLNLVHRDLKPHNILLALSESHRVGSKKAIRVMLSDFGLSRKLETKDYTYHALTYNVAGSVGWRPREVLMSNTTSNHTKKGVEETYQRSPFRITKAIDIFSLGCVFYYILSNGEHPFGSNYVRERNIIKGRFSLDRLNEMGAKGFLAKDLLKTMLHSSPEKRPSIEQVLIHPFFWSVSKKLDFLIDVSDRYECEPREPPSALLQRLELHTEDIIKGDWTKELHESLLENLGKYRKYDGGKVLDILRVLRNKKHHYQDLPEDVKQILGSLPDGFYAYFNEKFPKLFVHCYRLVTIDLKNEDHFCRYFKIDDVHMFS
ncbi:IRE protein kinase Ire1 [Schizosaccharomyces japonicus yFS275]|uniref:non-specific serine/threonine protein kinase n=1 Tax=Schizosaccharomyces japonicus (strain yFS275 / FY16936) TaxID=402676 RepID=B6K6U6_SCHJY|nr:IRE protein kinase Ire1 [Schizosaccharomyces japonicus yFS275]EEB09250.1 IRE protein kinase Ire1 [Schizosaccharomyces japonicus yFS275]